MLGQDAAYDRVPYFFSDQYDLGMEYSGYAGPGGYDQVVFRGDVGKREFIAFWLSGGRVLAGMNVNIWDVTDAIAALVRSGQPGRPGPAGRPRRAPGGGQLPATVMDAAELRRGRLAAQLRVDSIRCSTEAGSGHPTSSLSAADLMAVLLAGHLRYDWDGPAAGNDHLIFSKGTPPRCCTRCSGRRGDRREELVKTYRKLGARLQGHPTRASGSLATGSLGQGAADRSVLPGRPLPGGPTTPVLATRDRELDRERSAGQLLPAGQPHRDASTGSASAGRPAGRAWTAARVAAPAVIAGPDRQGQGRRRSWRT